MKKLFILAILLSFILTACSVNEAVPNSTAAADQAQSSEETTISYSESSTIVSGVIENSEPLISSDTSSDNENFVEPTCIHNDTMPESGFHFMPILYDPNSSFPTEEEYQVWLKSDLKEKYWIDGCVYKDDPRGTNYHPHNIAEYIREFNISRKDFEKNYYTEDYYMIYYDVDVLFGYDYVATSKWYIEEWGKAAAKVMPERALEENLKEVLFKKAGVNIEGKLMMDYSIPQIIYDNNIPKETVATTLEYIDSLGRRRFEYNLDLIYNKDSAILESLEKVKKGELYPVQVDEMIRVDASN